MKLSLRVMLPLVLTALFVVSVQPVAAVSAGRPSFGFRAEPLPLVPISRHVLVPGETVTSVASEFGITVETILSYNGIQSPRGLRAGQTLLVPAQDGLLLTLDKTQTVSALAATYQVYPDTIRLANDLPESTNIVAGKVFVPGAKVDPVELRLLLGRYFFWPTKGGRISSYFGKRNDPFTGLLSTHSGVDIAIAYGSPVFAAGDGVVTDTGYSDMLGNYIRIEQPQGFASIYGHLSAILTKPGRAVQAGTLIGKVGSTGHSTGPHLHFSAYRWNKLLDPMKLFG